MILLTNGYVHPVDAPDIPRGFVAFSQGKITAVGTMDRLSADLDGERYDLKGAHICPGFVDAHCHLGLFGNALGFEGEDGNEATDPVTPHLRALDAVNPQDRYFAEARCAGVTTVLTCPGSANPVSGQGVILKTAGRWVDEMVLSASACMKFALGENPKAVYSDRKEGPVTRMATAALIRESLAQAREYGEKKERSRVDPEEDAPEFDAKCEALLPVLSGQVKAHFHAHRADDIATALRISREFGLRPVIVHATEGHLIGELLEREQVPVITGPCLTDRSKPELAGMTLENPAILARHTPMAICTDHPETPIQYLPLCAALAAQAGMDEEEALAAITINAACIAGVDDRLGSLTIGKDADIVITSHHPFEFESRVQGVWIDGREVTL
jgi:imidazolonepropionase-like amidohydrolase